MSVATFPMRDIHNFHYHTVNNVVTVENTLWLVDIYLWTIHTEFVESGVKRPINHKNSQYAVPILERTVCIFGYSRHMDRYTLNLWQCRTDVCVPGRVCLFWLACGQFRRTSIFEGGLMDNLCLSVLAQLPDLFIHQNTFGWWHKPRCDPLRGSMIVQPERPPPLCRHYRFECGFNRDVALYSAVRFSPDVPSMPPQGLGVAETTRIGSWDVMEWLPSGRWCPLIGGVQWSACPLVMCCCVAWTWRSYHT
jgi:hypothetical protein